MSVTLESVCVEMKQRFLYSLWTGEQDDAQDVSIGGLICPPARR